MRVLVPRPHDDLEVLWRECDPHVWLLRVLPLRVGLLKGEAVEHVGEEAVHRLSGQLLAQAATLAKAERDHLGAGGG